MIETLTFVAAAGAEGDNLLGTFGIDGAIIVAQAINFLIVVGALYWFAIKPVLSTMDERQKKIADGLQYAEEMKSKLAESEREQAELLKRASEEAQGIVKEARDQAKTYYDQQVQQTSGKVEEMIRSAKQANEFDREKMLSEVRQEIAQLVVATSAKVLDKELTDSDRSRYNDTAPELLHGTN